MVIKPVNDYSFIKGPEVSYPKYLVKIIFFAEIYIFLLFGKSLFKFFYNDNADIYSGGNSSEETNNG